MRNIEEQISEAGMNELTRLLREIPLSREYDVKQKQAYLKLIRERVEYLKYVN